MRHPTDGTLRRLLDEPDGVADADRDHIAHCPACQEGLNVARDDAAFAATVLRTEIEVDVDTAWTRFSTRPPVKEATVLSRWRSRLRSPVVAIAGAAVLVTGAGAAAAADWFQIFHAERVAPVTAPQAELAKIPELDEFGDLVVTDEISVRRAPDVTAAQEASGLTLPAVAELPPGVSGTPGYFVVDRAGGTFTFSADTTARTAAKAGTTAPPVPPGLDGSRFRLSAGPGLAAVWASENELPALVVARVTAPSVYSAGVPFTTVRDYLTSLTFIPDDVAAQLRGFSGDGTLPLFSAIEEKQTSVTDVGGRPATLVRSGSMAGVVWVADGVVNAVAGTLTADEVLTVARGLR
ncbi:hypothetical protein [Herbidospora sp. NBRC 101105]|uniref:hypothetical protein n=1 Tax=Herbidospora sp. NBRC 101105 TaxID=3032195 RepID=UPI00249FE5B9|nr:hypothetical protein [Herbidospora sp. NBRC 101105]GLX93053.1 hypothetical protein Hesp01_10030 [Herbidospora sp. NBRC 101105]